MAKKSPDRRASGHESRTRRQALRRAVLAQDRRAWPIGEAYLERIRHAE